MADVANPPSCVVLFFSPLFISHPPQFFLQTSMSGTSLSIVSPTVAIDGAMNHLGVLPSSASPLAAVVGIFDLLFFQPRFRRCWIRGFQGVIETFSLPGASFVVARGP